MHVWLLQPTEITSSFPRSVLLIDENISYRVCKQLSVIFEGSVHVSKINLIGGKDRLIWEFARNNGLAILTHDTDFVDMANLFGAPPKVIKIKEGNMSNQDLLFLLHRKQSIIRDFVTLQEQNHLACLII